jgi:hypothetical protein
MNISPLALLNITAESLAKHAGLLGEETHLDALGREILVKRQVSVAGKLGAA